jgi:hypothetical protein
VTASRDHHDNRGVFVELWVLDLVQNDYPAAFLLSQLMWWAQPAKDGRPKLTYRRDGELWLVRPDDGWHDELRLTARQVEQAKRRLKKAGLVVTRRVQRGTAVVTAMRPNFDAIREQADTGTEYTRSRSSGPDTRDRVVPDLRDRGQSSSSITTTPLQPAPDGAEESRSARPSPRPSPQADDLPGSADAGLTPGAKTKTAPAAASTDKHDESVSRVSAESRRMNAETRRMNAETRAALARGQVSAGPSDLAEQLARRLCAEVTPVLAKNVRVLKVDIAQLLENGFSPDEIDAAARHPECHSWTYNALAFHAKKARGRRPVPRQAPPEPEEEPVTATPEQIAAMLQSRNRRRAKLGYPLLEVPA